MPHRIHKCRPTNTLYDYVIIINTYVSLIYELKKMKICKSVVTGPSYYEQRIYRATVSQRLRNTALEEHRAGGQLHIMARGAIRIGDYFAGIVKESLL